MMHVTKITASMLKEFHLSGHPCKLMVTRRHSNRIVQTVHILCRQHICGKRFDLTASLLKELQLSSHPCKAKIEGFEASPQDIPANL